MPVHPEVQAYIDLIDKSGAPPYHKQTPQNVRRIYRSRRAFAEPPVPEVSLVQNLTATGGPHGPIPLRLYRPLECDPKADLPTLVYFHGGGMMIGDLETHDTLCRSLCNQSGYCLMAVDYRLCPEFRFPVGVEDCWAALCWIREHAKELHVDVDRLAVGGDSAGGTLAAVMTLMTRESGGPQLFYQVLIYPATDQAFDSPSHIRNGQGFLLTRETIEYFREHYLDQKDWADWRSSPLKAESLKNLPPALIVTAGYDPLLDDGEKYAERLRHSGVPVTYKCYEDMIHGFIRLGGIMSTAREAVTDVALAMRAEAFRVRKTEGLPE